MPWAAVGIYHLATRTSNEFCRVYLAGQLLAQAFTYIPATWLLSIRVLALYPPYPKLRVLVYGSLILTHISVLAVGCYSFTGIWYSIYWNRFFRDCGAEPPRLLGVALLLLVPFETLLLGLQLYHNFLHRKMVRQTAKTAGFRARFHMNNRSTTTAAATYGTRSKRSSRVIVPLSSDASLPMEQGREQEGQSEIILMSRITSCPVSTGKVKGKGRCPIAAMAQTFGRGAKRGGEDGEDKGLSGATPLTLTRIGSVATSVPLGSTDAQSTQIASTSGPPILPSPLRLPPLLTPTPTISLPPSSLPPTPIRLFNTQSIPAPALPPAPALDTPRPVTLPLMKTLYMDGTMYFLMVFSMRLFTGLMLIFAPETLFYLSIFAEYALTSTAISRLFVHLRMVARGPAMDDESEDEDCEGETQECTEMSRGRNQKQAMREDGMESEDEEEEDYDGGFVVRSHERRDLGDEEMG